jgi:hypothetical protein
VRIVGHQDDPGFAAREGQQHIAAEGLNGRLRSRPSRRPSSAKTSPDPSHAWADGVARRPVAPSPIQTLGVALEPPSSFWDRRQPAIPVLRLRSGTRRARTTGGSAAGWRSPLGRGTLG